ncbi:ribonuclease P protein component [Nitratifractor sp.]
MSRIKTFETLRNQRDFERVYRRADKVWHTPGFVLFYRRSPEKRVAFVAGKKVGKAVRRNRAKRLLKAHFLSHIDQLKSGEYIFVAKASLPELSFAEREKAFLNALRKSRAYLGKEGEEPSPRLV